MCRSRPCAADSGRSTFPDQRDRRVRCATVCRPATSRYAAPTIQATRSASAARTPRYAPRSFRSARNDDATSARRSPRSVSTSLRQGGPCARITGSSTASTGGHRADGTEPGGKGKAHRYASASVAGERALCRLERSAAGIGFSLRGRAEAVKPARGRQRPGTPNRSTWLRLHVRRVLVRAVGPHVALSGDDGLGATVGSTGFDGPPFGRQGPDNAPSMRATRSLSM